AVGGAAFGLESLPLRAARGKVAAAGWGQLFVHDADHATIDLQDVGRSCWPSALSPQPSLMSGHDSILTYANSRYLWISLALMGGSLAAYIWHDPGGPANGGTWLGYTLGTIAALMIVWLMLFGIRKRNYMTSPGTLRGSLSVHVYRRTSLIFVVLLHTGFDIHWNLHTFTFVLMLIVIFSGFFGMYVYLRYPTLMTRNRESATRAAMLEEIAEIDQNALALADGIDPK